MDAFAGTDVGEIADDIEQILAAEGDGLFDLSPVAEHWLLDTLDRLALDQAAEARE